MSADAAKGWQNDFGLNERVPPGFFPNRQSIDANAPQAHLLRRAFDVLRIDGVLCVDHSPLAYFKVVKKITPELVFELQMQFWNHSGATLLVLVDDARVHIYSGMMRPAHPVDGAELPSLVTKLDRVGDSLRGFIVAVESGEFFRRHQRSFDPSQRVDRDLLDNLQHTRAKLGEATRREGRRDTLDALLCRLVFTSYLFDRKVIGESYLRDLGISRAADLRSLLQLTPLSDAKDCLYRLFDKLKDDFNGDLFNDDLAAEKRFICDAHLRVLRDFFNATDVSTGQASFWPYDFAYIPIETISAIYERFLEEVEQEKGAFYTPRFLAEVVLDSALASVPCLIGKRFLDPACGSGIFLVGLFNRLAEEWKQANPTARNDKKAKDLISLLKQSLFGIDVNRTACRITAFSLYLAYLDQLSPPDIQALQRKGRALPPLIAQESEGLTEGNIFCEDFFDIQREQLGDFYLVIGNPPWGSVATPTSPAGQWCKSRSLPVPDKQIASAFVWKCVEHVLTQGRVCLLLPHGVLFNHSATAVTFQKEWIQRHAIERVLNLADFQRFLFEKAGHPALIVSYQSTPPKNYAHTIEYWVPKADWIVTKAEVISVAPQDRLELSVGEVLRDLKGLDAPQIWKLRYWATPRDWRLLDRMAMYDRLRDVVRGPKEKDETKPWMIGVGYQPETSGDNPAKSYELRLPTSLSINASNPNIDLFLLRNECTRLASQSVTVRLGSNKNTTPFKAPHVLVAKGFSRVAFADFHVAFQDALRGIHGPKEDRDLLIFLAAYLSSSLAKYYLFHTSSNWGVSRQVVNVDEMLRLPFPLPKDAADPKRAAEIVKEVAEIVECAMEEAKPILNDRIGIVKNAKAKIEPLLFEYFDLLPQEQILVHDTVNVIVGSTRPTRARLAVPTLLPPNRTAQAQYEKQLCSMLNKWAKKSQFRVTAKMIISDDLGIGVVVLSKTTGSATGETSLVEPSLLAQLNKIRRAIPQQLATLDIARGVMVFDANKLYLVKPIGHRFWTQTAALNDADEIASTLLMRPPMEKI